MEEILLERTDTIWKKQSTNWKGLITRHSESARIVCLSLFALAEVIVLIFAEVCWCLKLFIPFVFFFYFTNIQGILLCSVRIINTSEKCLEALTNKWMGNIGSGDYLMHTWNEMSTRGKTGQRQPCPKAKHRRSLPYTRCSHISSSSLSILYVYPREESKTNND